MKAHPRVFMVYGSVRNGEGAFMQLKCRNAFSNLVAQQSPAKGINDLSMDDIQHFMGEQFDLRRFVIRERYKFWSDLKRKTGEPLQELFSRICHDAVTCDF